MAGVPLGNGKSIQSINGGIVNQGWRLCLDDCTINPQVVEK